MDTYSITRQFADSWMLLAMFVFFLGVVVWVFRPGSSKEYKDTANIPFRHENKPADDFEADAQRKEARP
ncbi:cbb3-type cytochrome c oxidase subunit 3 [Pseudoruegeria sp. SHC-113]|uniref:cbb3-type cytochrome c oxidase subunit 3 n=1 Tax=Pseudoruegeria sp. SHC-113 TaxID=2855439 RepID=UPI0021BA5EB5|nr:cbb3-type cytochrome c oxidase subunit 3 [Pseudoruegeria sp. SHC-113]MCT8161774.1 cbb3-type cytochrome c oxidase subunit 3 [Pseudoruegeria sp. SHC-113]